MRIRLPKDSPFWTSFVFHGIALLLLFFFVVVDWIRPQKKVHIFEMVSLPDTAVDQNPVVTGAPKPERQPKLLPDPEPETKPKPTPKAPPKLIKYSDFIKKNPIKDPKPQNPDSSTFHINAGDQCSKDRFAEYNGNACEASNYRLRS